MIDLSYLKNATVLLSGGTGYIGSKIILDLMALNSLENYNITIVAIVRDIDKAKSIFGVKGISYICSDIRDQAHIESQMGVISTMGIDYVFHCAAPTKSIEMITNPVETADAIVIGTRNMLEIARKLGLKGMVYLSSMEVYGEIECTTPEGNLSSVSEDQLGDIDITSPRSCYPLSKRMAEYYCYAYHAAYAVPVKVVRLAQTFGKGVHSDENRVFAQFAKAIIQNKDILLHTTGESMGNYVDLEDAIDGIFTILSKGENGQAYNVVNESNTMTIYEMAGLVAQQFSEGRIKVTYDIPKADIYGYAAKTGLRLSSQKLRMLGWIPKYSLIDMYEKMITELRLESNRLK